MSIFSAIDAEHSNKIKNDWVVKLKYIMASCTGAERVERMNKQIKEMDDYYFEE